LEFVPLYSPTNLGESAFIESLLKYGGIRYYVHGEVSSRMYPQLSLNQRTIYVHHDDFDAAKALLESPAPAAGQTYLSHGGKHKRHHRIKMKDREDGEESTSSDFPYWWLFIPLAALVLYALLSK